MGTEIPPLAWEMGFRRRDTARAMSQENVEIVRRLFEARGRKDVAGALALLAENIEIDASRRVVDPIVLHGHDGFVKFIAMLDDAWSGQTAEPYDVVAHGDEVVVPIRLTSTGRVSGAQVQASAAWVGQVRDGKITRMCVYQSKDEALEAVGLSESGS